MEAFLTAHAIDAFLARPQAEIAFFSSHVVDSLRVDLQTFPTEPASDPTGSEALAAAGRADAFFNSLRIPVFFGNSPAVQIRLWERVLAILREADERRYAILHKGTPFYFLGVASYIAEDFERALYYLDCALSEDLRLHAERWHLIPSGMFVRLDSLPANQFGRQLVHDALGRLTELAKSLVAVGADPLTLELFRSRLVNRAMQSQPELRSVVTALLSFVLELQPRRTQLTLAPAGGSGEPFFLHLFKGGLLFETLLKSSPRGKVLCAAHPKATLNTLLTDSTLTSMLGHSGSVQGLNAPTFDDLLARVGADETAGKGFPIRALQAAWGVRNSTGHNVAWPNRPTVEEYERLFVLLYGSLSIVLNRLYEPELLANGAA
jgi:hypothetical protein